MRSEARPQVALFVGPSVPADEIQSVLNDANVEVTLLPPAEQGDILRLVGQLPDVIGIIDGQFFHAPAVLHREILLALEKGTRVLGAASIGALRAAELDVFGMEGVGEIYRLYRTGRVDGDDEVAVLHAAASEGYRPLTEALVSIRHNLSRARRRGVIAPRTAAAAVAAMKRLHFSRRTYKAVLATVPADERPALVRFLEREAIDLKRADALLLADTIADRLAGRASWPARVPVRVNQTSHFSRYQRLYCGRPAGTCHIPDHLVLAFARLLSPTFQRLHAQVVRRCLAVDEARQRGLSPEDRATRLRRFRETGDLRSDDRFQAWLRDRWMSSDELDDLLRERDLEAQVLRRYRDCTVGASTPSALHRLIAQDVAIRHGASVRSLKRPLLMYPGIPVAAPLIRELKLDGLFGSLFELAGRILQNNAAVFERLPWLARAPVRRGLLAQFVANRLGVPVDRLEVELLAHGFSGYDDMVEPARHLFIYERTSAGAYRPERLTDCFLVDPNDRPG
jgi:hypothetical protein